MNDAQLTRNLQSIGQSCFVKYYNLFASPDLDRADVIEILKDENDYIEKSCISRTSHAKAIFNAGRNIDALNIIISSDSPRVAVETKQATNLLILNNNQ